MSTLTNKFQFFDIRGRSDCTMQFYIGGRRIGKSYSTISYLVEQARAGQPFIYMRLTQKELAMAAADGGSFNPFKSYNKNNKTQIVFKRIKGLGSIHIYDILEYEYNDVEREEPIANLGLGMDLLTVANVRGVELSDYDYIMFDEFIPTAKVRRTQDITSAGRLFAEAYDTIVGVKELTENIKTYVIFLANSFSLDSSILAYYGLVKPIQGMLKRDQHRYTDKDRSIYVELCDTPEIAAARSNTTLFKALGTNNDYAKMSLANQFNDRGLTLVRDNCDLRNYKPLILYDERYNIYEHKSESLIYCCQGKQACEYTFSDSERTVMQRLYKMTYYTAILDRRIGFDSIETKLVLDEAFNLSYGRG